MLFLVLNETIIHPFLFIPVIIYRVFQTHCLIGLYFKFVPLPRVAASLHDVIYVMSMKYDSEKTNIEYR